MKRPPSRKHTIALRTVSVIGLLLIIFFLHFGGTQYASATVIVFLSALAIVSGVGLLATQRRELAEATNRHIDTLEQMLSGCQIVDFDWRYVYVNEAAVRQGRMPKQELLGNTMMQCYPGIDSTALFPVLIRCMEERTFEHVENEFTHNDGSTGWFELSIHPVPEGIFIESIDITQRKLADLGLRHQLDRLHSLRAIDLAILGTTDLAHTMRTILDEARGRLRSDGAAILFLQPDSLVLEVAAATGNMSRNDPVHVSDNVMGKAARELRTIAVTDTVDAGAAPFLPAGVRAIFSTPLVAKGQLIGVFTVTFCAPFDANHDWIDYFETVAGQAAMAIESGRIYEELERSHLDLRLAYDTTIEGWSRALDLRDKETEGHTQRVTELTIRLARKAGMTDAQITQVRRGALLHDIGKMGVPDDILLKPAALTPEEWEIMRRHPTYAYELIKPIDYLRDAIDIPFCHHEKWDGTGYPRGLKGEEIPLAARLFAVVDVWDAIRSDRPYRSGWDEERALTYIRSVSGTHFDPRAVELFTKVHAEGGALQYRETVATR